MEEKEKNLVIWKAKGEEYGIILDPDEIEEVARPGYYGCIVFHDLKGDNEILEEMNKKLEALKNTEEWEEATGYEQEEMIIALSCSQNYEYYSPDGNWPSFGNYLAYDRDNDVFYSLDMGDPFYVYRYWDGSRWAEIYLDDMFEYEVILLDSYDLDVWDGSNWQFRGKCNHGLLHKAIIDGEPGYILEEQSQYAGSLPQARIFWTAEEAARELEDHDEIEMIRSFLGLPDLEEAEE